MYSRKWLVVALVACGLASACNDFNTNLSLQTASSTLTYLSPGAATVGGGDFTLTANGSGFVSGAIIIWDYLGGPNQVSLLTTFVSSTQLTAQVPASFLATPGTIQIAIDIPGSATSGASNINATTTTEVSNVVFFSVGNAPGTPPAVTSLSASTTSQASTPYCSPSGLTLTVNGANFTSDAVVNWNGSPRATTFVSATQVTAAILPADTAFPGTAMVSVSNSVGLSSTLPFTMVTPGTPLATPTLSSITPNAVPIGNPSLAPPLTALTVTGTSILPCSVLKWVNSSNVTTQLATTYVSGTQLTATVPASDFFAAGTTQVVVFTLGPGGGTSGASPFTISPPSISAVSSSLTSSSTIPSCGTTGFTLTVTGTNFVNGSVVNWNGSPRLTTFVSSTQLTAAITTTDAAFPGTSSVYVSNLTVNSNSVSVTTSAPGAALPAPAISILTPARATAGGAGFTLSVTGSNFVPCTVVQWNGATRATTFVNSTQMTTLISAADLTSVGTAQVTAFNLTSGGGGGVSNEVNFPIVGPTITALSASTTSSTSTPYCSAAPLTLTVTGTDFESGLVVNWNGSPRTTTFVSATQLSATITPADTAFPGTATVTVSNATTTSNSAPFTMTTPTTPLPTPSITSLSPANTTAGSPAFILTVNDDKTGSLLPCSVVQWTVGNQVNSLTTTFVGTTGINAAIPASYVASSVPVSVAVSTPTAAGGGGISNALAFTIFSSASSSAQIAASTQFTGSVSGSASPLSLAGMSADQRYAVFVLASTDGVNQTPGAIENIFVRDTCTGAPAGCTPNTTIASVGFDSNPANGNSISPSISADGRYVTFISAATNLVGSDTNGVADVFVRDTCTGVTSGCTPSTQRVSVAADGTQANSASSSATISADGRYVTFFSSATNLGSASSSAYGIYLRDTCAGAASGCTPSTQPLN